VRKLCDENSTGMPHEHIDEYVSGLGGRRVAEGEWGLEVECGGWPLHVGLRVHRGLLRAQAAVVGPDVVDAAELLHRNRSLELVRYASTRSGEVWVIGDLPVHDADVDRVLGALVEAARSVRER
jgi:hypothetical protein